MFVLHFWFGTNSYEVSMLREKLNAVWCENVAQILGATDPKAERAYRLSLVLIDTNPVLCAFLQLRAFGPTVFEICKTIRRIKSE
jgi:hypothetical protein